MMLGTGTIMLALMVNYGAPQYVAVEAVCLFLRWAGGSTIRDCICERCWEAL